MFVIPCKYSDKHNYVLPLTKQIRQYHPDEEIVVVDSDSDDKSYFKELEKNNVIIEDVKNKNYHVGAYWHCYKKYDREFYYFLHDSMVVNENLDSFKNKDLSVFSYFDYGPGGDVAASAMKRYTKYNIPAVGKCVFGPIFFCRRSVMDKLCHAGMDKILPTHSQHTKNPPPDGIPAYAVEGAFGIALNQEGYNFENNTIIGNIIDFMRKNCSEMYENNSGIYLNYPLMKIFSKRE